ncbi:MAG: beta-propeller fold lactonase family protein [Eubacteriales bacterium]
MKKGYVGTYSGSEVTGLQYIYTANYHLGTVTKLKFDGKLMVESSYLIKEKAGCHQIIKHHGKLYVPCLYLDKIYVFDQQLTKMDEITFPKGSGCRHGVVSVDEKYLYVIGELSNKVYAINLNTYEIENEITVLPHGDEYKEGSGAIRLSKDGTKLYISTRECNIITVIKVKGKELEVVSIFSAEGDHPRDILNVVQDKYLLVANRYSNELCAFDIKNNNKLINKITIPEVVSIVVESNGV